ncbi:SLATT domain-containing protein [Halobacillus naozhouensis]|uniref:SLATT domain-containing protein n=1 Tax=Halobacillus naozhouensis TaxID=554880 RepID=A0ABY8J4X9_9BACI|nr:SLATT domain-containing protein [Halobacillus naozhouensis]WFT75936.1 SLATT domain-containing protein [Halobacillus naozhouensis]
MKKDYKNIDIVGEVNHKIKTLDITRYNRIYMSQRLSKYSEEWKFVFFLLNIEAIIFVTLSLTGVFDGVAFNASSGIFSIYVILAQYYINGLNYNERSLKMHYHQLDIEDLILRLKNLLLKYNSDVEKYELDDMQKDYELIMNQYQTILKNNENHDPVDNQKRLTLNTKSEAQKGEVSEMRNRENCNSSGQSSQTNSKGLESEGDSKGNGSKGNVKSTIDDKILFLNRMVICLIPIVILLFILQGW